jgi:SagB-type dehydrogenase family enzyme
VFNNREPLLTLVPNSPYYDFHIFDLSQEQKYLLSRFAYWHRVQEQLVLESPQGFAQIILESEQAVMLISKLMKPQSCQALAKCISTISLQTMTSVFNLLLNAGLLSVVDEAGQSQEDKDEVLRQWEFHDLLFHTRTRFGRSLAGFGRTYRFLGEIQPLPAVRPQMSPHFIPLYQPDIDKLKEDDLPFTRVMEQRESRRSYGEKPIADRQLGEFLYRVARVRGRFAEQPNSQRPEKYQLSRRPYPSGGATYALELYITVDRCENIPSGFYHYCPLEHKLYKVSERNKLVDRLLRLGRPDPYESHDPQVLITIAARFQRMSWKYEAIAYALLLKECGILSQSMNLVATAMGLASCIIGVGDADLFAQLAGTNYYAETCIGEFALGSTPIEGTE